MSTIFVVECFAAAEKKLLDAMDRQRSRAMDGKKKNSIVGGSSGSSATIGANADNGPEDSPTPNDDDDPDDMAAAFFAMQANKKRTEELQNQNILDDWATIILRKEKDREKESSTVHPPTSGTPEPQTKSSATLAEELLVEFETILSS